MKNVIENLKRRFGSLKTQERDVDFFLCLTDYINFIDQTPETKEITDYLYKIAEKRTKDLENQTKEIIEWLNKTRKELTNKIRRQEIEYEELKKIYEYYLRRFEKQSDSDSDSLISLFSGYIQCLLESLYRNGYKEIVKEFVIEKGNTLKFNYLKGVNHYFKEENIYENEQKTELWGAWQRLRAIQSEEIKKDCYSGFKKENYISYATRIHNHLIEKLSKITNQKKEDNSLKSIHLITNSLEPTTAIFLVLDERFEMPIRFAVKNKNGDPTYIKRLYDIAYFVDAPNKMVNYDKNIADGINNGLFRKGAVAKYMKTNRLNKPTLVQKSENKTLVLKNDILVKTGRDKNDVPIQFQSFYIDKTR